MFNYNFSKQEIEALLNFLNRVEVKGIKEANALTVIAKKLSNPPKEENTKEQEKENKPKK